MPKKQRGAKRLDRSLTMQALRCAETEDCGVVMLGHGEFALVDMADLEMLNRHVWHKNGKGHAARLVYVKGKKVCDILYMHRAIMGEVDGVMYDHINRNKLDNRRNNLRIATHRQNIGNTGPRTLKRPRTSRFKGVSWDKSKRKWYAQGRNIDKCVYLGKYDSEVEAAKAYNAWAANHFGEFAYLNPL